MRSPQTFAPPRARALEHVASRLIPTEAVSGPDIVRQGDPGHRFYIIEGGEMRVAKNGYRVATLGHGQVWR